MYWSAGVILAVVGSAFPAGCDPAPDAAEPADPVAAKPRAGDGSRPDQVRAPAAKKDADPGPRAPEPVKSMPGAEQAFAQVVKLIDEHYVDGPVPADVLWTGALEGVMNRLIQVGDHEVNTLLSPEALAMLKTGVEGRLTGIGIVIEHVVDLVVVRDVLPESPAARAGLRPGDRVLAVDDHKVAGAPMTDVVGWIRGPAGTQLDLFVQRDTDEWTETIVRDEIRVAGAEGRMLDEGVGYLRLMSFSEETPAQIDEQLKNLRDSGARALLLDLRQCPGGLLPPAIEVAARFLPAGAPIVTVEGRAGAAEEHRAPTDGDWHGVPLVVLIDGHTASGAEVIAAALADNERATLVGEPTLGKGTVETIHELENGWAVKLSVSRLISGEGRTHQGVGVRPDVAVAGGEAKHVPLAAVDPASDTQLDAALTVLRLRAR